MKINDTKRLLAEKIRENRKSLNQWYQQHAQEDPPPFYSSVDLRDSGHKIVPVDSNLYPAGFNNICPDDLRAAPSIIREEVLRYAKRQGVDRVSRILVIPEGHTQNLWYIENLYYFRELLQDAGFEVRVGWYGSLLQKDADALVLESATQKQVSAYPIEVKEGVLGTCGFEPDLVLLNNDFSSGYPHPLDEIRQPVLPSHRLGWHTRRKSEHFRYYNQLAGEFAEIIGIEPWIVQLDTVEVPDVNFNQSAGIEEVAREVDALLKRVQEKYTALNIRQNPFAFVKSNVGTYGMGITVAHSGDEIRNLNRRGKNKMSFGKNKLPITSVLVQEGVPTATLVDRLAAEPVIYLVGSELIGGFLRTHTERGSEENLNTRGMVFKKLCMSDLRRPDPELEKTEEDRKAVTQELEEEFGEEPVLEMVYGAVAKIAALAAGKELTAHGRKQLIA